MYKHKAYFILTLYTYIQLSVHTILIAMYIIPLYINYEIY